MKTLLIAITTILAALPASAGMTKADYLTTRTVKNNRGTYVVEVTINAPKPKDAVMTFAPVTRPSSKEIVRRTIKAGSGKHVFALNGRRGWWATMSVNGSVTDKETATRKTGKSGHQRGLDSSRGL